MRFRDIITEAKQGRGTLAAEEARAIGDCSIKAILNVTGLSWDEVWEAAKPHFGRFGMNSGDQWATLDKLGWNMDGYYKPPFIQRGGVTVQRAEEWLQANDPNVLLICSINVDRMGHAISFKGGCFDNVQGAYRAKIRLSHRISRKT